MSLTETFIPNITHKRKYIIYFDSNSLQYSVKISSVYDKWFRSCDTFSTKKQPLLSARDTGILVKSVHFQVAITFHWKIIFVWNFEDNIKLLLSVRETNVSIFWVWMVTYICCSDMELPKYIYQNWHHFTTFCWFYPFWWPNISISVDFKQALTDHFWRIWIFSNLSRRHFGFCPVGKQIFHFRCSNAIFGPTFTTWRSYEFSVVCPSVTQSSQNWFISFF